MTQAHTPTPAHAYTQREIEAAIVNWLTNNGKNPPWIVQALLAGMSADALASNFVMGRGLTEDAVDAIGYDRIVAACAVARERLGWRGTPGRGDRGGSKKP